MSFIRKAIGWLKVAIPILGVTMVATCSYLVSRYEKAYDETRTGNTMFEAINKFGTPSVIETRDVPFLLYASERCTDLCVKRLWWEHPILVGVEAWSVEIDPSNHVTHKVHWVSP